MAILPFMFFGGGFFNHYVIHLPSTVIQDTQEVELGTSSPGFLTGNTVSECRFGFFTTKFLKFLGVFCSGTTCFSFRNFLVFGKKYFSSYSHFLLSCFWLDKLQLTKDVFAANTEMMPSDESSAIDGCFITWATATQPLADIPLNPGRLMTGIFIMAEYMYIIPIELGIV